MRFFRFVVCAAALGVVACDDAGTEVILAPDEPLAHTRFVNVVPDTGGQDWRFVDDIENSPVGLNVQFRGFTPYQATTPGARPLRVFPTTSDIHVTSTRLIDTTLTFEAGQYYTIVHMGLARPGGAVENRVVLLQDDAPDAITAGNFALRAMHLGTGWGDIDVYGATSTSAAYPGSELFTDVSFQSVTNYREVAVGGLALRALPVGEVTSLRSLANTVAQTGEPGVDEDNLEPIGGTEMPGSAMLAIFTPGSVVGSSAPQGAAFVRTTSDTTLFATATGYARTEGSFISNGFFVGQQITVDGFANAQNNGTSVITDVTALTLTVTKTGGTTPEVATKEARIRGPRPAWVYLVDKHPR